MFAMLNRNRIFKQFTPYSRSENDVILLLERNAIISQHTEELQLLLPNKKIRKCPEKKHALQKE